MRIRLFLIYCILFCVAASIAGVVCSFVPPFHTFTQELATLLTAGFAVAAYFAGCAMGQHSKMDFVFAVLCCGLGLACTITVLMAANAVKFHCQVTAGVGYLVLTAAPAILLSAAVGAILAGKGWGWGRLACAFVGIALISLLHDAAQLYWGHRVFPVDFFLGDLNGLSQRADMNPSETHVLNRGFVALLGVWVWWAGLRWRAGAGRSRLAALAGGMAFVLAAAGWGSYFGIGTGDGMLRNAVQVEIEHERFTVNISDSPSVLAELDAVSRELDWNLHRLLTLWDIGVDGVIDVFVFDTADELDRQTGLREPHAAIRRVYTDVSRARWASMRHELVHAIHDALNPDPRVLLNRAFIEGTATAFGDFYAFSAGAHRKQAGALGEGMLPHAQALFGPAGFRDVAEHAAYDAAGSFFGYLVLEHGMERFVVLQRSLDFEGTYGKHLGALDEDWRAFLSTIEVPAESLQQAQFFYDPLLHPGFSAATCPKVGEIPDPLEERAEFLRLTKDYAGAAEAYEGLYESSGEVSFGRWAGRCYELNEDYGAALAMLETLFEAGGLRPSEEQAVIADRVRVALRMGNWDELYATYDLRAAAGHPVAFGSALGEACLRDAVLREDYAAAILETDAIAAHAHWERMLAARPDFEPLRYLYAVGGALGRSLATRVDASIRAASVSSEYANRLGDHLWSLYESAMAERAYDAARRVAEALSGLCDDPYYRFLGEEARGRLAFEAE